MKTSAKESHLFLDFSQCEILEFPKDIRNHPPYALSDGFKGVIAFRKFVRKEIISKR